MKTTINVYKFINDMIKEWNGFSYDGAKLLFDYLEQLEDDLGESIDYDPIAFRCEYNEYCAGDYINDYYEISENFINYLLENDEINEKEAKRLKDDNYKALNANKFDDDILKNFFDEINEKDENIVACKDYDTFICLNY